jgi:S-adenosylmethionine/arginine decarboxylase-like enzyme
MGMHLICAARCSDGLSDRKGIERFLRNVTRVCQLHLRHSKVIRFPNGHRTLWEWLRRTPRRATEFGPGVTGIVVLSESHLSIHTTPQTDSFYFDLFSCRDFQADRIRAMLEYNFNVTEWIDWKILRR